MTEQFNEGFKETLFSLLASAVITQDSHILADIFRAYELKSAQQQIEALQQVKKTEPQAAPAVEKAIQQIKQKEQPVPKAEVVQEPTSKEEILNLAAKTMMPFEIYGTDLDAPKNVKLRGPHKDSEGKWTVGVGHLIGYGRERDKNAWLSQRKKEGKPPVLTKQEMLNQFKSDIEKHYNLASTKFDKQWDTFSDDLKVALIDTSYIGNLIPKNLEERIKQRKTNPNVSLDLKFVNLIKQGNFQQAANEYLVHKKYQEYLEKDPDNGIVKRMNRNADIIKREAAKKK